MKHHMDFDSYEGEKKESVCSIDYIFVFVYAN